MSYAAGNGIDSDLLTLSGLVSIYSPTLQEKEVVDFCVDRMTKLGYQASIDEIGNAIGVMGDGPNELILLGHIDTVPGFIKVRHEGDVLWGRGSVDAKGPLACFISSGARVGPLPGWRMVVIGAVGEEGNSRGAHHIVNRYHPQAAIIGEPSGWDRLTLGYKGSFPISFIANRAVAHSSVRGPNANEIAVEFWNRLVSWSNGYNEGWARTFDQLSVTLKEMHSSSDGYSDTSEICIGMRLPVRLPVEEGKAMVERLALEGKIEFGDCIPAFQTGKNNLLVRSFLTAIRTTGGTPGFLLKTGTADMNIVGPIWGCPILAYGPGDSSLDHTPEEHISIQEYKRSIVVLAKTLSTLCSA